MVDQLPQAIWHALPIGDVTNLLATPNTGLTNVEAHERLERDGANELQTAPGPSLWSLILKQLLSPLIYMLLAASLISALTHHIIDAIVILAVVGLNTVVGVIQEWRAEKALEALRRLASPQARVLREDKPEVIPVFDVVPGDVLLLESGDRIAADARLLDATEMHVDESALTGESQPVEKFPGQLAAQTTLADRTNMLWMTTAVTGGRGRAVVTATGMNTIIGEIAREVRNTAREETPLQQRIARLGTWLGVIAIFLSGIIFLVGTLHGFPIFEMFLFAVAAAVSAIPEGLPAVISVVLALGVQRMAARHAIIRRLPAVETLGSTTVICSDKTGTITRNEMTVTQIWAAQTVFQVSGEGFGPEGDIIPEGGTQPVRLPDSGYPALEALLLAGCVANDAILEYADNGWRVQGDPTEGALLTAARKAGLVPEDAQTDYPRLDEIPFSSKHQFMATLNGDPREGTSVVYMKGAPERVLASCSHILIGGHRLPLTETQRQEILTVNDDFASNALRVLAAAYNELTDTTEVHQSQVQSGMTFLGLWGMLDPPRPEAIRAIGLAQKAGIRIIMITGDHATTATAIARQVGIITDHQQTVTGDELANISDQELPRRVGEIAVFARVSPTDKLRIVSALHARGEVVAMTGDGVNDAPALKRANIGIAMGVTGTEVAKEAADMVLTDDNFATIVRAVEEGRVIFNNLRKVVFYLITTNLGELLTVTAALFLGLPLPLTAVMILWVNLVTDGVCTAPLGVEPNHWNVLDESPRPPKEGIIDRPSIRRIAILSPIMTIGTLGVFWYADPIHNPAAQTVAFSTMVAFQWFHALNARSHRSSFFHIIRFPNKWLYLGITAAILLQLLVVYWRPANIAFKTVPLSLENWGMILLVASSIFWADEILKLFHLHERK